MSQIFDVHDLTRRTGDDDPIPALLPRDWPARVGDVVAAEPRGAAGVAEAVRRLVDGWVLVATFDDATPSTSSTS